MAGGTVIIGGDNVTVVIENDTESTIVQAASATTIMEVPTGIAGDAGASAYQVAVANGFVGNEAAWLASLQGAAGADGADGAPQNLFIQDNEPVSAIPYLWIQTNYNGGMTVWVGP